MYAETIPQLRTLPHLGIFDYQIPSTFNVHPGDLVEIDFRNHKYTGLVLKTKTTTKAKKIKNINKIITDYKFSKNQLEFLIWFTKEYKVSPALALKTILPEIPQKKSSLPLPQSPHTQKITINKNRISEIKKSLSAELLHYNNFNEKIAFYTGLIKKNKQTLIITPEKQDVLSLASYLSQFKPLIINAELSKNQLWQSWIKSDTKLIIGTKRAIFFPPQNLDLIIIDDEEGKSHHNYDQNPKYHIRECAEKIATLNKIKLVLTSQAPSIYSAKKYKITKLLQPSQPVKLIDMDDERKQDNYTWFSEALIEQIKHKKSFLLFNRKGLSNLLVCKDCHEVFPFQEINSCPSCHGQNLKTAGHGTAKLTEELRHILPNKKIVQLTKDEPSTQDFDICLGTEYALRNINLEKIQFIGIISVDHQLTIPDAQANQRVYQLITKIINLNKPLILQTNAPDNPTIQAAIHQNYEQFFKQEYKTYA